MELRTYLEILRRRRWLLVSATMVVALLAGVTSALRTPMYRADAQVLLRPNDPSEQLDATNANTPVANADRYLSAQLDIIKSEAVARAAATEVPGATVELLAQVSAGQSGATDIVRISATDPDPARATKVANAFAKAYIENRRVYAVAGLERATAEIDAKLRELQNRIGELDGQIEADHTAQERASAKKKPAAAPPPVAATPPVPGAPQVTAPVTVEDKFTPTDDQALSAARYAAAVQYETLYARQQELLVEKSLKRGEAELISEAKTPGSPASPRPKRDALMGGILGLLLGLGITFLREQLDERLRTREEAETATGLPVLAELPFDDESSREPDAVASMLRPSGALAEATRGLRTSLTFLGVDEPVRRVVVTSSVPGEGKSLVAANLAIAYAQAGMRTILVSADLRRSRTNTMFSVPPDAMGLSEVIAGLAEFLTRTSSNGRSRPGSALDEVLTGVLRPTSVFGLFLLPAGKVPPNPAELLGSQKAAEVFDALLTRADVIVIDTPPVLAVTDAAVLAPRADGVVVVASAGETHRGALARSVATLTGTRARVLGVVFNKVDRAGSGYGYGYYGRYYRGYYGQGEQERRSWLPWKRAGRPSSEVEAAR
jgi:non-specific protein-tyrosine kinase